MDNKYYIVKQENCDPNKLSATNGMKVVTFKATVLDKYNNNPDYEIITSGQNGSVGLLKSLKQSWSLQIDVHDDHVNTWLYKLAALTEDEQAHFAKYNIHPKELSLTAHNRWIKGQAE